MCYVHLTHRHVTYLCYRVWGSTPELNKLIFLKKKIWMFILTGINVNKYPHVNSGQVLPLWELILNLPSTSPNSVWFFLWIGQFSDSVSLEEACTLDTGWLEYPTYHGPNDWFRVGTQRKLKQIIFSSQGLTWRQRDRDIALLLRLNILWTF